MNRLLTLATFLFVVTVASAFAQTDDDTRILEVSNDFEEIKTAFQRRVHDASLEFKYFHHEKSPFDVNGKQSELFNIKAQKKISNNKYFIFDYKGIYMLFLVNKEDGTAIVFFFTNSSILSPTPCSQAEIDKALGLYLGL
jgi:hypothetical protein